MRVATLTLEEQDQIRDLQAQRKRYYEAGTQLRDLMKSLARKHFSTPLKPFYDDKLTIDRTGTYIILE